MTDNVLEVGNRIIVFNGGNPLQGCPKSYEEADNWVEAANADRDEFFEPKWSFDCGFKLDFDGPILSVSSRFYPPKTHYGPKWDGSVTVFLLGKEIMRKEFEQDTLDHLKDEVEKFVRDFAGRISMET